MSSSKNMTVVATDLTGDWKAELFDQVFRQYYRRLCYFVRQMGVSNENAEDLVVNVFVKMWEKNTRLPEIEKLQSYLFQCVKNTTYNYLRDTKRSVQRMEEYIDLEAERLETTAEFESAQQIGRTKEAALNEVYKAVDTLPPYIARIIRYSYMDQKSTSEIATLLNISEKSVRDYKLKAIKLLKGKFPEDHMVAVLLVCMGLCEIGSFV